MEAVQHPFRPTERPTHSIVESPALPGSPRADFFPVVVLLLGGLRADGPPRRRSSSGALSPCHESRTDLAMLLGALFLTVVGAGRVSLDRRIERALEVKDARSR